MTTVLFPSPQRKIARARKHIKELNGMIEEFSDRLQAPTWEHHKARGVLLFKSPVTPAEVDEVGEVVGDAAHCLRAALDRMAVDLVRLSRGNPKKVYFPMGSDAENLKVQIKEKHFDRAGPDAVALLTSFQPHNGEGGNRLLRALHDLDIVDKHQAVLQLCQAMVMPTVFGANSFFYGNTVIGRVGEAATMVYRAGEVELIKPPDRHPRQPPPMDLLFAEGHPLEDRRVVPVLDEMASITDDIVEAFAALFRARHQ